jgi:hypothetical protein
MTKVVEHLPSMCEALSSNPQYCKKNFFVESIIYRFKLFLVSPSVVTREA